MRPCIYRIPISMREGKPQAYTPREVLIGPLLRSKKLKKKDSKDTAEASNNPGHLKKKKRKKYKPMEKKKDTYLESFSKRVGKDIVQEMRKTIQDEEENIRGSYEVTFEWMESEFFVDLILKDSVFIIELIIKLEESRGSSGDIYVDSPGHTAIVIGDLILLENQLPHFIFDKLFGPHLTTLGVYKTLDQLFLELFSLHTKIKTDTNFMHFTDMFRCAYAESLEKSPKLNDLSGAAIMEMKNVDNLSSAGVEFKTFNLLNSGNQQQLDSSLLPISIRNEGNDYSLHVVFNKSCLVMSSFHVDEASERILRNVIAYEQCNAGFIRPYTSNYIHFINFLITTDRDVEILATEGVLPNATGRASIVVEMVNKLMVGLNVSDTSQYHSIAMNLKARYNSRTQRYWATLKRVYFSDLWTGTATIVAVLILFMTLVGTVASVIQTYISFYPPNPNPSASIL